MKNFQNGKYLCLIRIFNNHGSQYGMIHNMNQCLIRIFRNFLMMLLFIIYRLEWSNGLLLRKELLNVKLNVILHNWELV